MGYIKVKQFTQNSASLVQKAITELKEQGAAALVLDLRDNPGGYLSEAVGIAGEFMRSGTVVEVQTKDGISAKTASGQPATDAPLVVLANKNTAAAAEVVVAALKESQRAHAIVGTTTLGKGSVQVMHDLSFGGALRYTAAYYLTPEGHAIDKVGVAPTVTLGASAEGDSQRDYAIELAGSLVPAESGDPTPEQAGNTHGRNRSNTRGTPAQLSRAALFGVAGATGSCRPPKASTSFPLAR